MNQQKRADSFFLWIVVGIVLIGSFIFVSAWFGLLARDEHKYTSVLFTHAFSVVFGLTILVATSHVPYLFWKKYSFYIFIGTLILTTLVFIPHVGQELGGARRWIYIFGFSLQPAEFLKLGFLFYFAALLSSLKGKLNSFQNGVVPLSIPVIAISLVLLKQPDTGTLMVILASGLAMYIAAGGTWKYIGMAIVFGAIGLAGLAFARPYVMDRFLTFFDPSRDAQNGGWQIKQSLIAIGSGGMFGRGFGQSVQKFNYLPEPIGDSIFAVAGEEFGFFGTMFIIVLFIVFAFRGFYIANNSPNQFSGLLVVGIVILIVSQSFINIGAMLGVFPLSGKPLVFISHGGWALIIALFMTGIVLNISKFIRP